MSIRVRLGLPDPVGQLVQREFNGLRNYKKVLIKNCVYERRRKQYNPGDHSGISTIN